MAQFVVFSKHCTERCRIRQPTDQGTVSSCSYSGHCHVDSNKLHHIVDHSLKICSRLIGLAPSIIRATTCYLELIKYSLLSLPLCRQCLSASMRLFAVISAVSVINVNNFVFKRLNCKIGVRCVCAHAASAKAKLWLFSCGLAVVKL